MADAGSGRAGPEGPPAAVLARFAAGMESGAAESMDQLDEYLAKG